MYVSYVSYLCMDYRTYIWTHADASHRRCVVFSYGTVLYGRRTSGASMYNYMHANGLANTQSLCMCVRMHVYHNHTHTNAPTHPSARTYSHIMYTNMTEYYAHRTNAQEDAVQGMTPWFESVGLVPQDAKAVAVACFQQQIFDVISLCMMPEKSLCEA